MRDYTGAVLLVLGWVVPWTCQRWSASRSGSSPPSARAVPAGGADGAQGSRMVLAGALCLQKSEFKAQPSCQAEVLLSSGTLLAAEP